MSIDAKLAITVTINPSFIAEDWQLFGASPAFQIAAVRLNKTLANAVNAGLTRHQVEDQMDVVMSQLAPFGAADSEPSNVLAKILDRIFQHPVQSLKTKGTAAA